MKKIFWFAVLDLLLFAVTASAQTVSPIIAEGGKGKAKGEFTVTNNGVVSMVVTVQAMTFRLTPEAKAIYLPLDAGVAVKLTETIGLQGGASSLFNAQGGSVTLFTQNMNETLGVGVSNGRLVAGASSEFLSHGWDLTVGDKQLFLTTQQLGLSTVMRGVEAHRKNDKSTLAVFVGAVGQSYSAPFFSGATAKEFGTGFQYTRKFEPNNRKTACRGFGCPTRSGTFELSTVGAYTNGKLTALEGATYRWKGLVLQGTAGLLEKRSYFIGQATERFRHASCDSGR